MEFQAFAHDVFIFYIKYLEGIQPLVVPRNLTPCIFHFSTFAPSTFGIVVSLGSKYVALQTNMAKYQHERNKEDVCLNVNI